MSNILAYDSCTSPTNTSAPSSPDLETSSPRSEIDPESKVKAKTTKPVAEDKSKTTLSEAQKQALRNYSDSVQNFTYQLFLNFEQEFNQRQKDSKESPTPKRKYPKRTLPRIPFPEGTGL